MSFEFYIKKIQEKLKKFSNDFELELLGSKELKYPVIKIKSKSVSKKVSLIVAAGVHGEERAGPLALITYFSQLLSFAGKKKIKIIIYPVINFYGFKRNKRLNARGQSCNAYWIHERGKFAPESRVVKNDISQYQARYFISLHEQAETRKRKFYLYSFGDNEVALELVKVASKEILIMKKGFKGRFGEEKILEGIIADYHDGTIEDYMYHQGAWASICTETPLKLDLRLRMLTNYLLVREMIKIAAENI